MRLTRPWQRHVARRRTERRAKTYREFIRREAAIGGQLFGPIPERGRREFVCLNKHMWVWHEEQVDEHGVRHMSTTRYDIRPDGIYKLQDGGAYRRVSVQEARHLRAAATLYHDQVRLALYNKKGRRSLSKPKA